MARVVVSCTFSEMEIQQVDKLVKSKLFCSRSDAIRMLTIRSVEKLNSEQGGKR